MCSVGAAVLHQKCICGEKNKNSHFLHFFESRSVWSMSGSSGPLCASLQRPVSTSTSSNKLLHQVQRQKSTRRQQAERRCLHHWCTVLKCSQSWSSCSCFFKTLKNVLHVYAYMYGIIFVHCLCSMKKYTWWWWCNPVMLNDKSPWIIVPIVF